MKEKYLSTLLLAYRFGIQGLMDHIQSTDFFEAPASTQHHGAYAGGLVDHSLAVYESLVAINRAHDLRLDQESMIITALLHDVCKANYYKASTRNVKNERTGQWEKAPYFVVEDQFPLGHGEKSVFLISKHIELRDEEILAIRWHMGGFDDSARGGYTSNQAMGTAMKKHPLVVALHLADMAASWFHNK